MDACSYGDGSNLLLSTSHEGCNAGAADPRVWVPPMECQSTVARNLHICRVANHSPESIQNAELNSAAWQVDCCCHLHQDRCAYSEDLKLCSFTAWHSLAVVEFHSTSTCFQGFVFLLWTVSRRHCNKVGSLWEMEHSWCILWLLQIAPQSNVLDLSISPSFTFQNVSIWMSSMVLVCLTL